MRFQLYEYLDSIEDNSTVIHNNSEHVDSSLLTPTKDKDNTIEPWIVNLDINSKLPYEFDALTLQHERLKGNKLVQFAKQENVTNTTLLPTTAKKNESVDQLINCMEHCYNMEFDELQRQNEVQIAKIRQHKLKIAERERQKKLAEEKAKELELKRQMQEAKERQLEMEKRAKEADELKKKKDLAILREKQQKEQIAKEKKAIQERYLTNFDQIQNQFQMYKDKIKWIKEKIVIPVKNGDSIIKNNLSKNKRKINPKFGQLTHSMNQLNKIQIELQQLVKQTKSSDLSYQWTLNFIAKALVHQAETEIGVKPENSLPLSRLTIYLLQEFPELSDLLMARFVKKCPYIIGYNCPIDTEEGRLKMGWKRKNDNKWEDDITYDERMSGIMTFYSVITSLPSQLGENWNIIASWKFLARICNTPIDSLTNTHFVVLGSWWDASGYQFIKSFGNQSDKLLQLIGDKLTSYVADKKFVGAARLRILWEDWATNHIMKQFPEMED